MAESWTLEMIGFRQTSYTRQCPVVNLDYPAPSYYGFDPVFRSAMRDLSDSITQALNHTTIYGRINSTANAFSINIYSLQDKESLLTYHHTPSELVAQGSIGVQSVDSNTVYRIGSITKVLTVYMYLIAAGDATWNSPVTQYVPELAAYVRANQKLLEDDSVGVVDWSSITLGSLASHLSGIAREVTYSPTFENTLQSFGLPPPTRDESLMCGNEVIKTPCNRSAFFSDYLKQYPYAAPFTTAIYSNVAFQILGYAIENITGKSMAALFNETLVQGLNLSDSYYTVPPNPESSFVPINESASLWNFDARDESPTGGCFASINDMTKIGRSIFNHTLMTPAMTRRWLKPKAFTSSNLSLGAPWEILRAPGDPVQFVYSKTGSIGMYGGLFALLPQWNIGFTVLGAGFSAVNVVRILSDIVADNLVPAIRDAAKTATISAYAGTYTNTTANSSITIADPETGPGLLISDWVLNGTAILSALGGIFGADVANQSFRMYLYPNGLARGDGKVVGWRASHQVLPAPLDPGIFSENCVTWGSANTITYSGIGLDEFLFTTGANGNAVSLTPRVAALDLFRDHGILVPDSMQRLLGDFVQL